jgi:hypothetical protein
MSNTPINYDYTQNVNCVSMLIETNALTLFSKCSFVVSLKDASGNVVIRYVLDLEGEEYNNWSNDDQYVVDWVKTKLHIQ